MIYKYTIVCLMALIVLFVIHLLIIKINYIEAVAPESSGASKTPSGLYVATDKVALLTVNNFNENVYNSTSAWLVQFYNSWCGHCIKFSPIWKQLAASIYNWRNFIVIGAIDCADEENTPLCREYEATKKPTVRYFPPLLNSFNLGTNVSKPRENHDPEKWRTEIIKHMANTTTKILEWPDFSPVNSGTIKSLRENDKNGLIILVVEKNESFVGRELILDLHSIDNVSVRYTFDAELSNPNEELPQVFVIKPYDSRAELHLKNRTRLGVFKSVRNYLINEGYKVSDIVEMQSSEQHPPVKVRQSVKQLLLVNKVFMDDLESSVRYSLFQEVASKPNISSKSMDALKAYLQVVGKYFPSNPNLHALVRQIILDLKDHKYITGGDFRNLLIEHNKKLSPLKSENWVGCKGSVAKYRRYPCSVWMTFHTMSVRAYEDQNNTNAEDPTDGKEVLTAMADYIFNFFGCQECAEHFLEMNKTMDGNVTSFKDGVMWLWKAHNTVNKRLYGDFSEDPAFPKEQFPVKRMCPKCYSSDGSWNEEEVLSYLVNMYSNIYNVSTLSSGTVRISKRSLA